MKEVFWEENHLSEELLCRMAIGGLNQPQRLEALEHIGSCQLCAGRFAEQMEQTELLVLPPQFEENVERKLREVRVTVTPLSMSRTAREGGVQRSSAKRDLKKELRSYSCRVALAACLALLLLFTGTFTAGMNALSQSRALNPDLGRVNELTQKLSDISKEIIHWEVKKND